MSAPTTDGLNDGSIRAFKPGERVRHGDLGEGVVIAPAVDGFIKVFFPSLEFRLSRGANIWALPCGIH